MAGDESGASDFSTRPTPFSSKQQPKNEELIVNTLLQLKVKGRAESTIKTTSYQLTRLDKTADLTNLEQVKMHSKHDQQRRQNNCIEAYARLATANQRALCWLMSKPYQLE